MYLQKVMNRSRKPLCTGLLIGITVTLCSFSFFEISFRKHILVAVPLNISKDTPACPVQEAVRCTQQLCPKQRAEKLKSKSECSEETYKRKPNCLHLFNRKFSEFAYAQEYMKRHPKHTISTADVIASSENCSDYIRKMDYIMKPVTEEESDFPIAYVLTIYTDIDHFQRLMRAIYAPQNVYCVHVDSKSPEDYLKAVTSIASCFDNVFLSSKTWDVGWGKWSQVEANLQCMRDLITPKYWTKWKYVINLTGHEYPLQTNYILVKALKAYNGNNDIAGSFLEGRKAISKLAKKHRDNLPHNVTYCKGEIHGLFTQKFVKFMLEDPRALEISKFLAEYSKHPDESLFQTLNYNKELEAPGGFLGSDEQAQEHFALMWPVRYKNWAPSNSPMLTPYMGQGCRHGYDHGICNYGIEDLRYPWKYSKKGPHLFLNKLRYNPYLVYDCLEESFLERRRTSHLVRIDTLQWAQRPVVKYGRGDGLL